MIKQDFLIPIHLKKNSHQKTRPKPGSYLKSMKYYSSFFKALFLSSSLLTVSAIKGVAMNKEE
ncbi:hypothetical protein B0I10_1236 [Flavobacterium lacus]|uniref:Uncharacterized protein n=1 Tax=Flavobacterium lacus TaxID=1353778 RepID=A0A328WJ91_9FLAO|nr:hypothetical protein B0I10_1236 [Flavobacterium lacus]